MANQFDITFIYDIISAGIEIEVEDTDTTDIDVTIVGKHTQLFATRIYDVRYGARKFLRFCNRRGVPCYYYEAFYTDDETKVDSLTGTYSFSGVEAEQEFRTMRSEEEANLRIGHFSPVLIKVLQPNYTTRTVTTDKGVIHEEEAEITVPAVSMFKRWDQLEIQDKNWIVLDEPKLIYDNKGMLEGFKLRCKSRRPSISNY